MLAVKQGDQYRIKAHRLTLPGSTRHKKMRHACQVNNEVFIINTLTNGNRQREFVLAELIATEQCFHAHNGLAGIRHLYAYSTLAGYRSDNADAKRSKA